MIELTLGTWFEFTTCLLVAALATISGSRCRDIDCSRQRQSHSTALRYL